ncbi:MAG: DinB family protein [Phycisphaerales bacterium]|nr:DinB family protein [Phycisphaerales bacterium]
MNLSAIMADQMTGTREWTLKLIADLKGDDWTFQPGRGMGHALWLCGHLACAEDLLVNIRALNRPSVIDPVFGSHFAIGEECKSAKDHQYPKAEEITRIMAMTHQQVVDAVREMSDATLAEPAFGKDGAPHPHYSDKRGLLSHCARHEAFHAGQIATIRRLLGKGFLR